MKSDHSKLPLWVLIALIVGMLLLFFWPEKEPENSDHLLGQTINDLPLMDLQGGAVSYSPVEGKVTVLNLWATWCPPCREEMPSLQRLADDLPDDQYQLVGIAMDHDDHLVREFLAERNVVFSNLLDATEDVITQTLSVQGLPSTLIINEQGRVIAVIPGGREWDSHDSRELIEEAVRNDRAAR
ncbi:MAG: TlpA family protein disulfide reductase [Gammaproteobacteria bacterium]|nr:TlpA family protein disulfide reductase [Gammaproteobacteria bacterium]